VNLLDSPPVTNIYIQRGLATKTVILASSQSPIVALALIIKTRSERTVLASGFNFNVVDEAALASSSI
jgi:hypothetical protein